MQKYIYSFLTIFTLLTTTISAQAYLDKALTTINRDALEAELSFLSSNWFEGREATTQGAFMAADYLASLYKANGLSPLSENSYFQKVPLIVAKQPKAVTLTMKNEHQQKTFKFPTHLIAKRVTTSQNINGTIIWGGYGLNNEQLSEINLKKSEGKILIRLKGLPQSKAGSQLETMLTTQKEDEWNKLKSATLKNTGAIAVLEYDINNPFLEESFSNSLVSTDEAERTLDKRSSGIYKKSLSFPDEQEKGPCTYKVSKAIMNELIADFDAFLENYLNQLQNLKATAPAKYNYDTIELQAEADTELKYCQNVLAVIEGSEHPNEIIVVGAHYDHLGTYNGYIWNGADDNGSGAIGVVAIARAFMATGIQPKRTVIFANWTAEERGLFGSRFFVKNFDAISKVKYYHNYDMVGRSYNYERPDSAVALLYTKAWTQAETLCKQFNKQYQLGLKINYSAWDNPTSGSDNAPFAQKGIPIMWFHTGGHESYHMPSDHVDKIDWQKYEAIVKTSFLTLWNLANE